MKKQVIHLRSRGNIIKTLVFRLESENDALWVALTEYAPRYKRITSVICDKLIY